MNIHSVTENFYGKDLTIETGRVARQADGAVLLKFENTVVLATVVSSKSVREGQDFFPLTVDYREKVNAAGKFRGGYLKREAKATQKETLTSRLTDRCLRPLFEDGFIYEVCIDVAVLSSDRVYDPDVMAILASSTALSVSNIPFNGPVGGVRVGRVDGNWIVNPDNETRKNSDIDLVMAGTKDAICMVEGHSDFISEEDLIAALDFGHEAIKSQVAMQEKLVDSVKPEKTSRPLFLLPEELIQSVKSLISEDELREALYTKGKQERSDKIGAIEEKVLSALDSDESEFSTTDIKGAFKEVQKKLLRNIILTEGLRADGRKTDEIRPISIETGILPIPHGSALFTRGETQALAVATLGGSKDTQRYEDFGEDLEENFFLHYSFPGFSVGETKPNRGPGRREIGHGKLAERALTPIIPDTKDFPYTIRITSDILESNGSSSMASVCGGSLCLMDAGVPVKEHVSGIAMGLVKEGDDVAILSDILGLEDALGDMDFKLTGSRRGITAFQMDIKIEGLSKDLMRQALNQANAGRLHILNLMEEHIQNPKGLSQNAPRIYYQNIPVDKIGTVIGPGGKMIRALSEKFEVNIDISDDGVVTIQGNDAAKTDACIEEIQLLTAEIEVGKVYNGTIKSVVPFGAFIECLPGKEGLLHISRIAHHRINKVEDIFSVGDKVEIKCIDIDDKGRVVLSRKELLPKEEE